MEIKKYNKANEKESTTYLSGYTRSFISLVPQYTHHYEIFPYTFNSIITMNGEIIEKQSYQREASRHKVIYNGDTTIVIMEDGSRGIAKCNPNDTYHKHTGYQIAKIRATIESLKKDLEKLIN